MKHSILSIIMLSSLFIAAGAQKVTKYTVKNDVCISMISVEGGTFLMGDPACTNKDYARALQTLKNVKEKDGITDYLMAIVNARQGNNEAAASSLRSALQKDPSLKSYADKDLELRNISK